MIIWLIGLSGVGKTAIGTELYKKLNLEYKNLVFLDGDLIRYVMGNDLGHSLEDRKKNADRICRLCKMLDEQNINVICSILSIFPESRDWNRKNYRSYYEIFIDVSMDKLKKRDNKNIYNRANSGELKNVAGVDIPFEKPKNPDFIIDNNKDLKSFDKLIETILEKMPNLD